jgi:hypothetical protein
MSGEGIEDEGSDAWRRWRTCGRKRDFETKKQAKKYAKKRRLNVYQCCYCGIWHITKQPQP